MANDTESHHDEAQSDYDYNNGWPAFTLFAMFMFITVAWEILIGLLSLVNHVFLGTKGHSLRRLQGEVLALGVVTLALLVIQKPLEEICAPGSQPWPTRRVRRTLLSGDEVEECAPGNYHPFSEELIHNAHYLLFAIAMVHIGYTMGSMILFHRGLLCWRSWEWQARDLSIPTRLTDQVVLQALGGNAWQHLGYNVLRQLNPTRVTESWYMLLRFMFIQRMRACTRLRKYPLRSLNFLNVVTIHLGHTFSETAEQSWLLMAFTAFVLLFPPSANVLFWLTLATTIVLVLVHMKLTSITSHLTSSAYFLLLEDVELTGVTTFPGPQSSGMNHNSCTPGPARPRHALPTPVRRMGMEEDRPHCVMVINNPAKDAAQTKPWWQRCKECLTCQRAPQTLDADPAADVERPQFSSSPSVLLHNHPLHIPRKNYIVTKTLSSRQEEAYRKRVFVRVQLSKHAAHTAKPTVSMVEGVAAATKTTLTMTHELLAFTDLGRCLLCAATLETDDPTRLFWFRSPRLMLFIIQFCYLQNSMALASIIYAISVASFSVVKGDIWQYTLLALTLVEMPLFAWVVMPLYGLVSVVVHPHPDRVMKLVKHAKKAEEEHYATGLVGWVVRWNTRRKLQKHHQQRLLHAPSLDRDEPAAKLTRKLLRHWVYGVGMGAGVIFSDQPDGKMCDLQVGEGMTKTIVAFIRMWQRMLERSMRMSPEAAAATSAAATAAAHRSSYMWLLPDWILRTVTVVQPTEDGARQTLMQQEHQELVVEGDMAVPLRMFFELDRDHGGRIYPEELYEFISQDMSTHSSKHELKDMIHQLACRDAIDFESFVKSLVFRWLVFEGSDEMYLTVPQLHAALQHLGLQDMSAADAGALLHLHASSHRLSMLEFMTLFKDVKVHHVLEAAEYSLKPADEQSVLTGSQLAAVQGKDGGPPHACLQEGASDSDSESGAVLLQLPSRLTRHGVQPAQPASTTFQLAQREVFELQEPRSPQVGGSLPFPEPWTELQGADAASPRQGRASADDTAVGPLCQANGDYSGANDSYSRANGERVRDLSSTDCGRSADGHLSATNGDRSDANGRL